MLELKKKIEEILNELCSWDSEVMTDEKYLNYMAESRDKLLSLFNKHSLRMSLEARPDKRFIKDNPTRIEMDKHYVDIGWNQLRKWWTINLKKKFG